MLGPIDARTLRDGADADARARSDLQGGGRHLPDRAVAAGAGRDQPGHARRRAAASAAQPARSPGAEERIPLDPAAARVHRRSQLAGRRCDARRSWSATARASRPTWGGDEADRRGPLRRARFGDDRAQSGAPTASSPSAPSPCRAATSSWTTRSRRCSRSSENTDGGHGARRHAGREPERASTEPEALARFSTICATA